MWQSVRLSKRDMLAAIHADVREAEMVAHSTLKYVTASNDTVIRYHGTDVLKISPDGTQTLNSGGYRTVTTKKRLNEYGRGFYISQKDYEWFVFLDGIDEPVPFEDGMVIRPLA